jgi:hypothetical protein
MTRLTTIALLSIEAHDNRIAELERRLAEMERQIMRPREPERWLSIEQASLLANRPSRTIRSWASKIAVRDGRNWLVDRHRLHDYMTRRFGTGKLPPGLRRKGAGA